MESFLYNSAFLTAKPKYPTLSGMFKIQVLAKALVQAFGVQWRVTYILD